MSSRNRLLADVDILADFVARKRQALSTSITLPLASTRKRSLEADDASLAKKSRTSILLDNTVEGQSQQAAANASQPTRGQKRLGEAETSSVAKKPRISIDQESSYKQRAMRDAVPGAPQSRKRRTDSDQASPMKRQRESSDSDSDATRLFYLSKQRDRRGRYLRLSACDFVSDTHWTELVEANAEGPLSLALTVNDLPERIRLETLNKMVTSLKVELLNLISDIQLNKDKYDPRSLYPLVATRKFMATLPPSAQECVICGEVFRDGYDVCWRSCGEHTVHFECYKSSINRDQRLVCQCFSVS